MKQLLCEDLPFDERMHLASFNMTPAYQIVKRMMNDACSKATAEVIKLDPLTEQYENKLKCLQLVARATNDFSATLLKSIEVHAQAAFQMEQEDKELEEFESKKKLVAQYRNQQ